MRLTKYVILGLALLLLVSGAAAQDGGLLTAFGERANFRDGPSPEWVILGTYNAGTPIRLDGQAYGGTWVRGIVPDGTVGWVIGSAVGLAPETALAQLPTTWVDDPFTLAAPTGAGVVQAAVTAEAEATVEAESTEEAEAVAFAPVGSVANLAPLDEDDFDVLPGEVIDDTNGQPFFPWNGDDGRINNRDFFAGLAVYCVGENGAPSDSYRGGGMQILGTDGHLILYVPSGVVLAGWQASTRGGQDVLLGEGAGVSLYATAGGTFRAHTFESDGKPISFDFTGCRLVPKATSDNCPPSWDRDNYGNCVNRNLY